MHIVVTDVTRMNNPDKICVAGADGLLNRVRPVLDGGQQLTRGLLAPDGPFALGAVVELGPVRDTGSAPMVEDRLFDPHQARRTGTLAAATFRERLLAGTRRRLRDIFGDALVRDGRTASVAPNAGTASLGLLTPAEPPTLVVEDYDGRPRLRMCFTDDDLGDLNLAVTDIRFFDERHELLTGVVTHTATRLRRGRCVVGVGLGRAWSSQLGQPPRHWLQVNGVHLADDPLWTVSGR